jgi:hypothetical protein
MAILIPPMLANQRHEHDRPKIVLLEFVVSRAGDFEQALVLPPRHGPG